ncbi:MAG: c-type cytochrome [Myxococcota bacterium]
MKRALKWLGLGLAVVVAVLAVIGVVAWNRAMAKVNRHWDVQPAAVAIPTDEASIKEGGRLFGARGCKKCHGDDGGGALILENAMLGTVYGPNLTRGKGSVTGNYTDADWVRTVRHGIKPDGYPTQVMDSKEYQYMIDSDLGQIIAFIKSMPPVDRQPPPLHITAFSYIWHGLEWLDVTTADQVDHSRKPAEVKPSAEPEFGKYVLRLQCQGCHGETLSGGKLSGAPGLPIPPNLTPDDETGLGKWTFEQFATVMRTGKRPDGRVLDKFMPWDTYAAMSDDELTAIWTFLRSQPPRKFGGR